MKRFQFPFEALARLRRRRREACELVHAQARLARDREATHLELLRQQWQEAEADCREALPRQGALDPSDAAMSRAYLDMLDRRIKASGRALAQADQLLEARRQELLEAARAEKAVERLRDRRRAAWQTAAHREEQAFLDEVGLGRRARAGEEAP